MLQFAMVSTPEESAGFKYGKMWTNPPRIINLGETFFEKLRTLLEDVERIM